MNGARDNRGSSGGYLTFKIRTASNALPVGNAVITVTEAGGDGEILGVLISDRTGIPTVSDCGHRQEQNLCHRGLWKNPLQDTISGLRQMDTIHQNFSVRQYLILLLQYSR